MLLWHFYFAVFSRSPKHRAVPVTILLLVLHLCYRSPSFSLPMSFCLCGFLQWHVIVPYYFLFIYYRVLLCGYNEASWYFCINEKHLFSNVINLTLFINIRKEIGREKHQHREATSVQVCVSWLIGWTLCHGAHIWARSMMPYPIPPATHSAPTVTWMRASMEEVSSSVPACPLCVL